MTTCFVAHDGCATSPRAAGAPTHWHEAVHATQACMDVTDAAANMQVSTQDVTYLPNSLTIARRLDCTADVSSPSTSSADSCLVAGSCRMGATLDTFCSTASIRIVSTVSELISTDHGRAVMRAAMLLEADLLICGLCISA